MVVCLKYIVCFNKISFDKICTLPICLKGDKTEYRHDGYTHFLYPHPDTIWLSIAQAETEREVSPFPHILDIS